MTKAEMQAWLKDHGQAKQFEFGLENWRIAFVWSQVIDADSPRMSVNILSCDYERATVTVHYNDYEEFGEAEFVSDLEHELIHIVNSPWQSIEPSIGSMLHDDYDGVAQTLYRQAHERSARSIERAIAAVKFTHEKRLLAAGWTKPEEKSE